MKDKAIIRLYEHLPKFLRENEKIKERALTAADAEINRVRMEIQRENWNKTMLQKRLRELQNDTQRGSACE